MSLDKLMTDREPRGRHQPDSLRGYVRENFQTIQKLRQRGFTWPEITGGMIEDGVDITSATLRSIFNQLRLESDEKARHRTTAGGTARGTESGTAGGTAGGTPGATVAGTECGTHTGTTYGTPGGTHRGTPDIRPAGRDARPEQQHPERPASSALTDQTPQQVTPSSTGGRSGRTFNANFDEEI